MEENRVGARRKARNEAIVANLRAEVGAGDDQGERFSPGYPAFPDLSAQRKIAALLKPARIGVSLTRTFQLVPEHTTSAIISMDARAKLFRP